MVLSIESIYPVTAPRGESIKVTMFGEGFTAGVNVQIGGINSGITTPTSDSELEFTTPITLDPGKYDVKVMTPTETFTLRNSFIIIQNAPQYPYCLLYTSPSPRDS